MNKKIYLAGCCSAISKEEREQWRLQLKCQLDDYFNLFNPCDLDDEYEYGNLNTSNEVMKYLLYKLKDSDIVVVNLDNSKLSCGTTGELVLANHLNKPIVGFGTKEDTWYEWDVVCCDKIIKVQDMFARGYESIIDTVADYVKNMYID